MKIQGPNPYLHAYKQQQQKVPNKNVSDQKDKVDISHTAKSLQKTYHNEVERTKNVQEIKELVQSGKYEVNHEKLAEKMIQFWKQNRS